MKDFKYAVSAAVVAAAAILPWSVAQAAQPIKNQRSGPASLDSFPGFLSDALPGYAASCAGSALKYTVSGVWPSSDECGRRVL
jgi:hypothetical protein